MKKERLKTNIELAMVKVVVVKFDGELVVVSLSTIFFFSRKWEKVKESSVKNKCKYKYCASGEWCETKRNFDLGE